MPTSTYIRGRAALVVATLLFGAKQAYSHRFLQDDAYISFVYARNLAEGHGLVYWPGEYVEGYSNFLWTVMVAFGILLGFQAGDVAQGLGILSFLGSLALLFVIIEAAVPERPRETLSDLWVMLPILVMPLNFSAASYATGGLATAFFGFLTLLTTALWLLRPNLAGAALLLLCLTRPEGPLLWVSVLVARSTQVRVVQTLREHVGYMAAFASYIAWRYYYYGDLLPNTFYAKSASDPYTDRGLLYLQSYVDNYPYILLFALLPILALAFRPKAWRPILLLAGFHALFTMYVVWVGGDFMEYKAIMHAFPAGLAGTLVALATLQARRELVGFFAGVLLSLATVTTSQPNLRINIITVSALHGQLRDMSWVTFGRTLKKTLPSDTVIACSAAGAIPYFSRLKNIDPLGLTERAVAKQPLTKRGIIGHEKTANLNYMKKRGVNLLLHIEVDKRRNDIDECPAGTAWVRVMDDHWLKATVLNPTPRLLEHMRANPDDFVLPDMLEAEKRRRESAKEK